MKGFDICLIGDYPRIKKGTTTNLVSDVAIVYCQSTDKEKGL